MTKSSKNDSTDIEIQSLLKPRRQISVFWSVTDVQAMRSDDQAWVVLQRCEHDHDCNFGFTWELIGCVAADLFPTINGKDAPT